MSKNIKKKALKEYSLEEKELAKEKANETYLKMLKELEKKYLDYVDSVD